MDLLRRTLHVLGGSRCRAGGEDVTRFERPGFARSFAGLYFRGNKTFAQNRYVRLRHLVSFICVLIANVHVGNGLGRRSEGHVMEGGGMVVGKFGG